LPSRCCTVATATASTLPMPLPLLPSSCCPHATAKLLLPPPRCRQAAVAPTPLLSCQRRHHHHPSVALNVKCYLINYQLLYEYGLMIFCLSFLSIDRATAPGQYEQFYLNVKMLTKHIPYPTNINSEDAIRSA
jgi:hypothetical protein